MLVLCSCFMLPSFDAQIPTTNGNTETVRTLMSLATDSCIFGQSWQNVVCWRGVFVVLVVFLVFGLFVFYYCCINPSRTGNLKTFSSVPFRCDRRIGTGTGYAGCRPVREKKRFNSFRTAVSFWGYPPWNLSGLSPKRSCVSRRVNVKNAYIDVHTQQICTSTTKRVQDVCRWAFGVN